MANNIYTGNVFQLIAAAGNYQSIFQIQQNLRIIKIKSIGLTWEVINNVTNMRVDLDANTEQQMVFQMSGPNGAVDRVGLPFLPIGGSLLSNTGQTVNFYRPGQFLFDSFYLSNGAGFILTLQNRNAAVAYGHYFCIMVETEEFN
jgi:hypothetical protein